MLINCIPEDSCTVSVSIPDGCIGLILHKRFFIDNNMGKSTLSNICIKCTLLSSKGAVPIDCFQNNLIKTDAVVSWILRLSNKAIINQLEKNKVDAVLNQHMQDFLQEVISVASQLSQQQTNVVNTQVIPRFPNQMTNNSQNDSHLSVLLQQAQNNMYDPDWMVPGRNKYL